LLLLLEVAVEVGLGREELELILGGNLRRWLSDGPVCRVGCPLEEKALDEERLEEAETP
jgi:hypothetical protein